MVKMNIHYLLCTPTPLEEAGGIRERKESWWIEHILRQELKELKESGIITMYSILPSSVLGFPLKEPQNSRGYRVDMMVNDVDNLLQEYEAVKPRLHLWAKETKKDSARPKIFNSRFGKFMDIGNIVQERGQLHQQASEFFGTEDVSQWARELDALEQPDPDFNIPNPMGMKDHFSYLAYIALVHEFGYLMVRVVTAEKKELPGLSQNLAERCIVKAVDV